MNKRQKKEQLKKQVSEILQMCENAHTGTKGDFVIFELGPRANCYGGRNRQLLEAILRRFRQIGVEAFVMQSIKGMPISVLACDEAIRQVTCLLEHLEQVRDKLKGKNDAADKVEST